MLKRISLLALLTACTVRPLPPAPLIYDIANKGPVDLKQMAIHLKVLSSDEFRGRETQSVGNKKAQDYIRSTLYNDSVKPFNHSYKHSFIFSRYREKHQGTNVIAMSIGSEVPEKYIVLSAHYDHIGQKGQKIFNGADDNASGTAALLALAKVVTAYPLKHSVIFLFTDAEEIGLKGAKAFVEQNPSIIDQTKLNINIDMIAGSQTSKTLHVFSKKMSDIITPETGQRLKLIQRHSGIKVKKGFRLSGRAGSQNRNWSNASDHGAFYRKGIPFMYFGVGEHENYHKHTDTYENVNISLFFGAAQSIYQQLIYIDENI
jgi:Zn-dependent M28 family amino/carboxypeptidase